ncbi:hypothetical protein DH86_00002454 [Scytalidium sp. 3C]|nr:hypothetical protein DH86_00002454 [Scytalidium sp. 3C]
MYAANMWTPFVSAVNPFSREETYTPRTVWTYRILAVLSWLLLIITSFYYSLHAPEDDKPKWRHTIWEINHLYKTSYSLNAHIVEVYWVILFVLQIGYFWHIFSSKTENVYAATRIGSHFILNNLLQFAFIMLFVRSHFIWAEVIAILNFGNLAFLYLRHPSSIPLIHIPAVSGPLAWTFIAIYWNGAIAVHQDTLAAKIVAYVAIWGILVFGGFFLIAFKDYSIGFALAILTASLGVRQHHRKGEHLQWIFAFVIMAALFVASLGIAIPVALGREVRFRREEAAAAEPDAERAPLLDDH